MFVNEEVSTVDNGTMLIDVGGLVTVVLEAQLGVQ